MNDHDKEGSFYKGLVFGALLGVGLTLFLSTDAGRDIIRSFRKKIDEAFQDDRLADDYEEVSTKDLNSGVPRKISPRRFFRRTK